MNRLSPDDHKLVECLSEIRLIAENLETGRPADDEPLFMRWAELSNEMIATAADTLIGVRAKAAAIRLEIDEGERRDEDTIGTEVVMSLIRDLIALCGPPVTTANVVPMRPAPSDGDTAA